MWIVNKSELEIRTSTELGKKSYTKRVHGTTATRF